MFKYIYKSKIENKQKTVMQVKGGSEDSLQAFMRNIREGKALDSNTRSKLRLKHQQLVKDVCLNCFYRCSCFI